MTSAVYMDKNDNNFALAGTMWGGLYVTYNAQDPTPNWRNLMLKSNIPQLGIPSIAVDPTNHNRVWAAVGKKDHTAYGIIYCEDISQPNPVWTFIGPDITSIADYEPKHAIRKLLIHPDYPNTPVIFAISHTTVYQIHHTGGNSFLFHNMNFPLADAELDDIDIAPDNSFITVSGNGVWKKDLPNPIGMIWLTNWETLLDNSMFFVKQARCAILSNNDIYTFYRLSVNQSSRLIKYISPGNWQILSNTTTWNIMPDFIGHDVGGVPVFYSENNGRSVIKSVGGSSWSVVSFSDMHVDIRGMYLIEGSPNGSNDKIIIGNDGGVSYTNTGGTPWNNLNGEGYISNIFWGIDGVESDPYLIFGGLQDNGHFRLYNNSWYIYHGGDGTKTQINDNCLNLAYGYDYQGSNNYQFRNFLTNIIPSLLGPTGDNNWASYNKPIHYSPSNNLYYVAHSELYSFDMYDRCNNPTATLNPIQVSNLVQQFQIPITALKISTFDINKRNNNVFYIAYSEPTYQHYSCKKLFVTIDGGQSFTDISCNLNVTDWWGITDIVSSDNDPYHFWITFNGYGYDNNSQQVVNRVIEGRFDPNTNTASYNNYSQGLTEFPVNCIVYEQGSKDALYIGTDVGVYYRNANMPQWECFNTNLPVGIVKDLDINHCAGLLRASVLGNAIWETPLANSPKVPHVVNTNTTIQGFTVMNTDLVVEPGVTLTISSTNDVRTIVSFSEGKRLIVKPGAKLVIDNATLTSACGRLWDGIFVGGNINQPQTFLSGMPVHQGMVELKNDATIEHASIGITTMLRDPNGNILWNSFGGIIRASNSNFMNNKKDVEFMSYPFSNTSYFYNCLFEVNQTLPNGLLPDSRVTMWEVKNVTFKGCKFKYNAGNAYNIDQHGNGIYSIDAKYFVGDYCNSLVFPCPTANTIHSSFENLNYGINSTVTNPLYNAVINNARFTNNYLAGAHLSGMHYPQFNGCYIETGSIPLSTGLYLNQCKYYKIQNNQFNNTQAFPNGVGIYTNESGAGAHEIYRNNFNNLYLGIAPLENNSGMNNFNDGLKMNCNIFNANSYDIAVMSDNNNSSVAHVQGFAPQGQNLTRNIYDASCGNENQWYIDGSTKPTFHASNQDANTQPLPQPDCSDLLVNVIVTAIPLDYPVYCKDEANRTILELRTAMSDLKNEITDLSNNYNTLLDGGNTQALLSAVASNMSPGNLKDLLMSKSPYLSDTVLIAFLNRTPPHGHTKEVLAANSPLTQKVKSKLDEMNLPNGIRNEINAAQTGVSARFSLEANIILKKFDLQSTVSESIAYYLNDTTDASAIDTAMYLIKTENRHHAACELVRANIYKGDYTRAGEILDTLENKPALSQFCAFQRLIIEMKTATEKAYILQSDPARRQTIEDMAADPAHEASAYAQALMRQVFAYDYSLHRLEPVIGGNRAQFFDEQENNAESNESFTFYIYPNPAAQSVIFGFKSDMQAQALLSISDLSGRTIESINLNANRPIDYSTHLLNNAIYLVTLTVDNKIIKQQKLVVIK